MVKNRVLIAGVHGVSGIGAAEQWLRVPNTQVFGLSRREAPLPKGITPIQADLLDAEDTRKKLVDVPGITHIVFAAYVEKDTALERSETNVALLRNLLNAIEPLSPQLQHVTFYQGGKAYGADLGPFKTPAREDDPRLMPPNFYYEQEDFLRDRQAGKTLTWTALRPEAICGFALGNPMNLAMVIAVYATISKKLGLPLRFPGTESAYRALYQLTSADILGEASVWAGQSPKARNEIFNITNGDYFRWQHLWPRIAKMFSMDVADPVPLPLTTYMADKAKVWDEIVEQNNLQRIPYSTVASWSFGDAIFHMGYDNITSTIKARKAGFTSCIDTEEMFLRFFARLRQERVIPEL